MRLLAVAALAATALSAGAPRAADFDGLVIFGDSLSDAGNAGRFSNGPVWVERLGARLGLSARPSEAGGSNFAVGGARLDPGSGPTSLPAQLARYREGAQGSGRALHVVFGGGNDLIAATVSPGGEAIVDTAVAALRGILVDLAEHGATDILVSNLPDIGMTPAARGRGNAALEEARRLTDRFNAGLARALAEIEARFAVRLHRLDVWAMAERARRDPAAFGFADVTTPCVGLAGCEGHLFWDDIHPTTEAHERLAEAAARLLSGM